MKKNRRRVESRNYRVKDVRNEEKNAIRNFVFFWAKFIKSTDVSNEKKKRKKKKRNSQVACSISECDKLA